MNKNKNKYKTPNNHRKSVLKTKYFRFRLTEDEYAELKRKSADFYSGSQFIRYAVNEATDACLRQRIKLMLGLSKFFKGHENQLSLVGDQLNQSVKRANELSAAGLLTPRYIKEELMPTILELQKFIVKMKQELETVGRHLMVQ